MDIPQYKTLKIIQKPMFLHPVEGESFSRKLTVKHFIFSTILTLPLVGGSQGYLYQAILAGFIKEALPSVFCLCTYYMLAQFVLIYTMFGERYWKTIKRISSDVFEIPESLSRRNKYLNSITWCLFGFGLCVDLALSVYYYINNTFCGLRYELNDTRFRCGYHTPVWYPFEEGEYIDDTVLLIWFIISENAIISVYTTSIWLFLDSYNLVSIRLKHLRSKVEAFHETDLEEFSENIKYFAEYYTEIIWCIKEFNSTLGYCMTLSYIFMIIALSAAAYLVFLEYQPEYGLLELYICIVILCSIGQSWEDEREKLEQSICNLRWYKVSPKMRKDYSILLENVKKPIHLIGQPNVLINNEILLSVTKISYNVLMFMGRTNT